MRRLTVLHLSKILGDRTQRSPQFGKLLGLINGGHRVAVPLPGNNPRTGRTGKLRGSHFRRIRHPKHLRPTRQNPSFHGGHFLTDNDLSRNVAFPTKLGLGFSGNEVPRNTNSGNGNGDGFTPSIRLPPTFVTIGTPIAKVAALPSYSPVPTLYSLLTPSLPSVSLTTGRPYQILSDPVYRGDMYNVSFGGRFSNTKPSSSYASTVTGRPSTSFNNNLRNNAFTKTNQELQNNLIIPVGAASGFNKNKNYHSFTDNIITDGKTEIISLKNLESKFKTFNAVNFFDLSQPTSEIRVGVPKQNRLTRETTTQVSQKSVGEGKPVISFVDELEASASTPSFIAERTQVSTPRMFTEILNVISESTSRPAAFDGQRFLKEIGPYPDVFATSSPSPAPSPFPIRNNNQLILSNPRPKPVFQNSNKPSPNPNFQTSNTFQNTIDISTASGPNPASFNNNNNAPNIRFPAEAFRGATASSGSQNSGKEPLSEDLLNLVNSLRGRLQPNGNKQQPRRPKNNQIQSGGKRKQKKNKNNKKNQKAKKSRVAKQQNTLSNAIQLISSSSLDGRLGRQAQKFGPNVAGPVIEGFPAGLPAATPEGVKIALSSPLGKFWKLNI